MTILQIEIEDSRPVEAHCDDSFLNVALADGRVLRTPLWWYPRLAKASDAARGVVELSPLGVHWRPQIDEDGFNRVAQACCAGRRLRPRGELRSKRIGSASPELKMRACVFGLLLS